MKKWMVSLVALAAVPVGVLLAQQDVVGTWQGTLQPPNGKELRIVMKISKADDGALSGTAYSIDQGGQPIPMTPVTVQGSNVKMTIPAIGGSYEGKLSEDGKSMEGKWSQGPGSVPLNVVLATPETAWAIPEPLPPPKSMAADADPEFEVATIKPSEPGRPGQSLLVDRAGMLTTTNTTLKDLMIFTFGVHPGQLENLPSWAETDKYDIKGKPDTEGIGNDTQIRAMMSKLLAERFKLAFHRENKELSAFTLNVGKDGPKLTVNDSGGNLPGFGGRGPGSILVRNSTMAQFAGFLQARIVDRPVVDKTGLTAKYDFTLTWRPDQLAAQPANAPALPADIESRPDLFTAMQEQLGLRFEAEKTPVEVLVVDKAEKPSEN